VSPISDFTHGEGSLEAELDNSKLIPISTHIVKSLVPMSVEDPVEVETGEIQLKYKSNKNSPANASSNQFSKNNNSQLSSKRSKCLSDSLSKI
jgi:hypothetical protein